MHKDSYLLHNVYCLHGGPLSTDVCVAEVLLCATLHTSPSVHGAGAVYRSALQFAFPPITYTGDPAD
jgi:hypothetical protein